MEELEVTGDHAVFDHLKKFIVNQTKFHFWQNIENKRQPIKGKVVKLDELAQEIYLETEQPMKFTKLKSLYAHSEGMNILFRGALVQQDENLLILQSPRKIKILEKRLNPRIALDDFDIPLKFHNCTLGHNVNNDGLILNVSSGGCLLRYMNTQLDDINVGDQIKITHLVNQEIPDISGKICHIKKIAKIGSVDILQFGIQVPSNLNLDFITQLIDDYIASGDYGAA